MSFEERPPERGLMRLFFCCTSQQEDIPVDDSSKTEKFKLPKIVVSSYDDQEGKDDKPVGDQSHRSASQNSEQALVRPQPTRPRANEDDLSKAHQAVIDQMRSALKEARGGYLDKADGDAAAIGSRESATAPQGNNNAESGKAITQPGPESVKPAIPPTKALAVAKIRAAIAQSRQHQERRETQPAASKSEEERSAPTASVGGDTTGPTHKTKDGGDGDGDGIGIGIGGRGGGGTQNQTVVPPTTSPESAPTSAPPQDPSQQDQQQAQQQRQADDNESEAKLVRSAAVAKLKAAILSAAMEAAANNVGGGGQTTAGALSGANPQKQPQPLDSSRPNNRHVSDGKPRPAAGSGGGPGAAPGGLNNNARGPTAAKRSLSTGDPPREGRLTGGKSSGNSGSGGGKSIIWDFFEEGRGIGTCKKCGYTVSTKRNQGGLSRHLSLVHQREYREYNSRMERNWTHGMMEKNLNMKLPKNI